MVLQTGSVRQQGLTPAVLASSVPAVLAHGARRPGQSLQPMGRHSPLGSVMVANKKLLPKCSYLLVTEHGVAVNCPSNLTAF